MFRVLRLAVSLLVSAVCMFGASFAPAQDYPNKRIRFIVANTPASSPDIVARIIAQEMSKFLEQPIIVENKPGAGGVIGYEYVAKQVPADGYTIACIVVSSLAILPVSVKDLRFDPLKDLLPVAGLAEGRFIFGSSSQLPWKTFNELVAHARANPGKLNYAGSGAGVQLWTEMLIRGLGLDIVHVPYPASARLMTALGAAEVHMSFVAESQAISLGDKFRVLAATGEQRRAPFLDVPTFAELGHPRIAGLNYSLNTPAGTPKAVVDKLYAAASRALQQPEVKALLAKAQLEVVADTPEAATKRLTEQARFLGDIAKQIGFQPQ